MNAIARLRAEHHELEVEMLRLINLADGFNPPAQTDPITVQLVEVARLLRRHLATEDEWFYPAMIAVEQPEGLTLAAVDRAEVSRIAEAVEGFVGQWNSAKVIAGRFERFHHDLVELLRRIENRIEREAGIMHRLAL